MQATTKEKSQKMLHSILRTADRHWVGDGFPVQTLFAYPRLGAQLSPFLLLDYAGPVEFPPTDQRLGVGEHPHRGFETVTIVYDGEVEHRDSSGGGGRIGPGDVQWMTAASGIIHEEWLSPEFNARGGTLEMAQLWVNLPARDKMAPPAYQGILKSQIPSVVATGGARVQVIAGEFAGSADGAVTSGPARTFSPVNVWDVQLAAGQVIDLDLHAGYITLFAVLKGNVNVNATQEASSPSLVVLDREGTAARLEAIGGDATVLVLHGEPLNEPVAGYGPFVMNTREEIMQAMQDFQRGTFIRQKAASA